MVEESRAEGFELNLVQNFVRENPVYAFGGFGVRFGIVVSKKEFHVDFEVLVGGNCGA